MNKKLRTVIKYVLLGSVPLIVLATIGLLVYLKITSPYVPDPPLIEHESFISKFVGLIYMTEGFSPAGLFVLSLVMWLVGWTLENISPSMDFFIDVVTGDIYKLVSLLIRIGAAYVVYENMSSGVDNPVNLPDFLNFNACAAWLRTDAGFGRWAPASSEIAAQWMGVTVFFAVFCGPIIFLISPLLILLPDGVIYLLGFGFIITFFGMLFDGFLSLLGFNRNQRMALLVAILAIGLFSSLRCRNKKVIYD